MIVEEIDDAEMRNARPLFEVTDADADADGDYDCEVVGGSESDSCNRQERPPPVNPSYNGSSSQLAMYDPAAAGAGARSVADHFQEKIRGKRRSLEEDDSQTAFGDAFAERFGHPDSMPLPSAPPWPEEENETEFQNMRRWIMSRPAERKKFKYHSYFDNFFRNGGVESEFADTLAAECFSSALLPVDTVSLLFIDKMKQRALHLRNCKKSLSGTSMKLNASVKAPQQPNIVDTDGLGANDRDDLQQMISSAVESLLGDSHRNIDYAERFPVYIPDSVAEFYANNHGSAVQALKSNPFFDEVQFYLQQSRGKETSAWNPMATQITSGTLDIRINAQSTRIMILGEGYTTAIVSGGKEAWKTADSKVSKDTDFHQDADNRYEIVRIKPGQLGLVQRPTAVEHPFMRLLPGRYVLLKKFVRLIGIAQLQTNRNIRFAHPDCRESDILVLGQRFSAYQLHAGNGIFVDDRQGSFFLSAPAEKDITYVFDYTALEQPNDHTVNPRDSILVAQNKRYFIVRLVDGQRIIVRAPNGADIVLPYQADYPELNLLHLPANVFEFNGKIYERSDRLVRAETISSVCLTANDVLVLRDDHGAVRFLNEFDPKAYFTLRRPWISVEIISRMQKEYVFQSDDAQRVALLKPASNQWPIIFDQHSGEIKMLPPSLEYVISTARGQDYVGMADRNQKQTQIFKVESVGSVVVAVVESGQIGMARINNYSFFLSPSPDPYIIRPPNEFLGLINKDEVLCQIPNSDLYRVYIPSGKWAVAMIDGRQVILDPARSNPSGASLVDQSATAAGSGIWIFRAQQFDLKGPVPVNEKLTQLFNVQRIQVPMDEVGYGYDAAMLVVWPPGNHVININNNTRFENFFRTKLDDIKISDFDVVWKNGVKGKIDVSVAFHIDGIVETALVYESDYEKIKQAIALCGHDSVLRNRIIENVQHHLLAAIAEMDPLGYGYAYSMHHDMGFINATTGTQQQQFGGSKVEVESRKTLLDLENLFSSQVQATLSSYGVKVDNVTITKNEPDEHFVQQSELMLKQLMEAHKEKQIAELTKDKEAIQQQQELQKMQAATARKGEAAAQAQIEREIQAQNVAVAARAEAQAEAEKEKVRKAAQLAQQEMESASRIKQQTLRIQEQEEMRKAMDVEMQTRQFVAKQQAETAAIEATAKALAEAEARLKVAELTLKASQLEAETQEFRARGLKAYGGSEMRVKEMERYGSLAPEQVERIKLAELQLQATSTIAQTLLQTGVPAPGITQLALAPEVLRTLGLADGVRSILTSGSEMQLQTTISKQT